MCRIVRIAARTAFAFVNNVYSIPAYVVWMLALRLVRPLSPSLYWKIEGLMYHWLLAMVSLWSWTAGYEILESGDEPAACGNHRTLVLANHQSTADVPILMAAWNPRAGILSNLMWIMDRVFKFTNFGIVSILHEDFFIQASLQVIPERAMKTYINVKYLYENGTINVRRYGRKSGYYINLEGTNKLEFGNNVSLNLLFFEYLHNEYKRSFVEMHFNKICDAINHDPYIGKAFRLLGVKCPFAPGRTRREASLEELRRHIVNSYIPLGRRFMVLFPEGGFLHKRREISQRFAEKNNLPKLEYVSLPRAGAMKVIMDEIGPHRPSTSTAINNDTSKKAGNPTRKSTTAIYKTSEHLEWVLDVTIAYPNRVPLHLTDVVAGIRPPCSVRLHYRLYPITEVPSDSEGMTQWLYDRFIEKDKMLEEYYRTGQFPTTSDAQAVVRRVRQDNLRYIILHSFFIGSTYVQYTLFQSIWSWFW